MVHTLFPLGAHEMQVATVPLLNNWRAYALGHPDVRLHALEKKTYRTRRLGPVWETSEDQAALSMRLPAFEDGSMSARLSDDGRSLKVSGTMCQEATLAEIALPFGPSAADDVELVELPDGRLSVTVHRKKPQLDVKIVKPSPPPGEPAVIESTGPSTDALEAAEAELDSKFKVVAESVAKQVAAVKEMRDASDGHVRSADALSSVMSSSNENEMKADTDGAGTDGGKA